MMRIANHESRTTNHAFTLVELMIVIVMFVILAATIVYVFRAVLLNWYYQETRAGIDISLDVEIEQMVRELREATAVSSVNNDEIRFTLDGNNYIYYLYNENDSYPQIFDQTTYEIRKTELTVGISGTFTYGDGDIIITDVVPPATSDLSIDPDTNMVTIDLSVTRNGETIRSRTDVIPRNL